MMVVSRCTRFVTFVAIFCAAQSYAFSHRRGARRIRSSVAIYSERAISVPDCFGLPEKKISHRWQLGRQLELEPRRKQREGKLEAVDVLEDESLSLERRVFFKNIQVALSVGLLELSNHPSAASAASDTGSPFAVPLDFSTATKKSDQQETGLLESRVTENLLSQPPYLLETTDVVYPSYFSGTWQVTSTCTDVTAPCGLSLFGGNATYTKAREDIGPQNALLYKARFVGGKGDDAASSTGSSNVIADRDYNVREIAKAAMGSMSVVDVPMATPNKFTIVLAPSSFSTGSSSLIQVDMIALARRQESINNEDVAKTATSGITNTGGVPDNFHAAEVVRQVVAPLGNPDNLSSNPSSARRSAPLIKEVETISLYTPVLSSQNAASVDGSNNNINQIRCIQRSATYLVPRQDDPLAFKMWEASRGRPVDVRYYDVVYDRLK